MAVAVARPENTPDPARSRPELPVWFLWLLVYLVVRAYWNVSSWQWPILDSEWVSGGVLKLMLWVAPCLVTLELHQNWVARYPGARSQIRRDRGQARRALPALGLTSSGMSGLVLGLVATMPMAAAVVLGGRVSARFEDAGAVTIGAFAEEVLFRGFLFLGLRRAGWRLMPSMLLSALAFGMAHNPSNAWSFVMGFAGLLFGSRTYFSDFLADFWRAMLWLAPFVTGGVLFAWLTHRWRTLWPAIGLHACLNLWWELAPGASTLASFRRVALEPLPIAHAVAVLIAIGITLGRTRSSDDRVMG